MFATEFAARTRRIVWCTVATVDRHGRPRTRILHPLWEGATGWIATGRHTLKTRHLAANPAVSLLYWDQTQEVVTVEGTATWEDEQFEKQRVWDLFRSTPAPVGYDLLQFWPGGPMDPTYGLLRIEPTRIELTGLPDLVCGRAPQIWWHPE